MSLEIIGVKSAVQRRVNQSRLLRDMSSQVLIISKDGHSIVSHPSCGAPAALPVLHCVCRLAEGALCPVTQVINKNAQEHCSRCEALGSISSEWPPGGLCGADEKPVSWAAEPVFSSPLCPLISTLLHQFACEGVAGDLKASIKLR